MTSITTENPNMTKEQKNLHHLIALGHLKKGYNYRFKFNDDDYWQIGVTECYKWSYFNKNTGKVETENAISSLVRKVNMKYGIPYDAAGRNGWETVYMMYKDKWVILDNVPGVKENRGKNKHHNTRKREEEEKRYEAEMKRLEEERIAREKVEAEMKRLEEERIAREKVEAEMKRLEAEMKRLEAERLEAERLAAEKNMEIIAKIESIKLAVEELKDQVTSCM